MRFTLEIDPAIFPDRMTAARIARGVLSTVILQNAGLIKARRVPRLYESGVTYERPSLENGSQRCRNAAEVMARGSAACHDLSAWRAAELRVLGDPRIGVRPCVYRGGRCVSHPPVRRPHDGLLLQGCPSIKIYWRPHLEGIYHCEVRLPNGNAEDPSRFLGMGKARE